MNIRFLIKKLKLRLITLYYKLIHNLNVGLLSSNNATIYPATGKGKFVSVYQKGKIIQIINEDKDLDYNEIRIIPTKYNHGISIEKWKGDELIYRTHLNIEQLGSRQVYMGHVEKK